MRTFDVVILGAGSAAATAVEPLHAAGRSVAVVADGRVGGACSYVACIPSKAMLHSARLYTLGKASDGARRTADHTPSGEDVAAYQRAAKRRDALAHHGDDAEAAQRLSEMGVTLIRGRGR